MLDNWGYRMKKFLCLFLGLMIFSLNTGAAYAITGAVTQRVGVVPRGTIVPLSVVTTANSDRLYSGDIIPLVITDDVVIDGVKVFEKEGRGTADIEKVIRSGSHGRAGFIEIKSAKIKDVYGKTHNVQLDIVEKGESRRPSAIFLSVIGVLLILIPFGIWREGDPAYVSGSRIFNAVTLN